MGLNKQTIIHTMNELGAWVDTNYYWVGSGGAMVLHGLREETIDIDLGCGVTDFRVSDLKVISTFMKAKLKPKAMCDIGGKQLLQFDAEWVFDPDTSVTISCREEDWIDPVKDLTKIDGVRCYSIARLLKQKMAMNRPKDQDDIKKLLQVLNFAEAEQVLASIRNKVV